MNHGILVHVLLVLFHFVGSEGTASDNDLIIETTAGYIQGYASHAATANNERVDCWVGIPFAEPPIGSLRFRRPVPISKWSGTKQVMTPPNSCPQIIDTAFPDAPGPAVWNPNTPLSEDCLYLNIVVPRPRPKKAAVMVWIYGGGFYSGTSTLDIYDLRTLAAVENVIVVSMQYRVASLGFLYFGTPEAPGNVGMLDQVLALEFIKNNIAKFGGDPDNISLFGESAGAGSVSLHLVSPLSNNLFNRAILQSGAATGSWTFQSQEASILSGLRLAAAVNCPSNRTKIPEVIECLRSTDANELVKNEWTSNYGPIEFPFAPVLDEYFLVEPPPNGFKTGNFKHAPILLGSNSNEGSYFLIYIMSKVFKLQENIHVDRKEFLKAVARLNPYANKLGTEAIIQEYTDWANPNNFTSNIDGLDKMIGDKFFTCPVNELALRFTEAGVNVFAYLYSHRSSRHDWPSWAGVMHADEINYVFGEPLDPAAGFTIEEIRFSRFLMKHWANFARTGNPSINSDGTWSKVYWPMHTAHSREYLELNKDVPNNPIVGHGPRLRQCAFWDSFYPQLFQNESFVDPPMCANSSDSLTDRTGIAFAIVVAVGVIASSMSNSFE